MNNNLYEKILEALVNELSTVGGVGGGQGSITGVTTPIGTGPKAGSGAGNIYKSSQATDKKHRSKGTKKKTTTKSVQYYLQHGPAKSSKRSLKENYSFLFEAKTPQLENLSKEQLLAFINHMLGNAVEGYEISMTEKFSGQHVSVLVGTNYRYSRSQKRKVPRGPMVFVATKQQFDDAKQKLREKGKPTTNVDVMLATYSDLHTFEEFKRKRFRRDRRGRIPEYNDYAFLNKRGASREILNAFKYSYPHQMPEGTFKYFGIEALKADDRKGDYISYSIEGRKQYAIVYSGDFTEEDAKAMTNPEYNIAFMCPHQAVRFPEITEDYIRQLNSIKQQIESYAEKSFKSFVMSDIKPQLTDLLVSSLGGSLVAPNSPFEGLFISIKDQIGFKIPNPVYGDLQRVQAPFASAFDKGSTTISAASKSLFEVAKAINTPNPADIVSDQVRLNSTGYYILNYVKTLVSLNLRPYLRIFLSPKEFEEWTENISKLIQNPTLRLATKIITMLSDKVKSYDWHKTEEGDSYKNQYTLQICEAFDSLNEKINEIKRLKAEKKKIEDEIAQQEEI